MKISIIAIGHCRDKTISNIFNNYIQRLPWKVELHEIKSNQETNILKKHLINIIAKQNIIIALDENGKNYSSTDFAYKLNNWQQENNYIGFCVGGPEGLSQYLLSKAAIKISFGKMTWPHLFVRIMLAEQLYRASSILSGHPYHRE